MRFFVVRAVHEQTNWSLVSAVQVYCYIFGKVYYLLLVKRLHSLLLNLLFDAVMQDGLD